MESKSKQEYRDIGEKLKAAEFKGVVVTKLKYIEDSVNGLHLADESHDKRIKSLETFQANVAGRFTIIGAIVILLANWIWDIGKGVIVGLKNN